MHNIKGGGGPVYLVYLLRDLKRYHLHLRLNFLILPDKPFAPHTSHRFHGTVFTTTNYLG